MTWGPVVFAWRLLQVIQPRILAAFDMIVLLGTLICEWNFTVRASWLLQWSGEFLLSLEVSRTSRTITPFTHSLVYSLILSFIHSFSHLITHSLIYSFNKVFWVLFIICYLLDRVLHSKNGKTKKMKSFCCSAMGSVASLEHWDAGLIPSPVS